MWGAGRKDPPVLHLIKLSSNLLLILSLIIHSLTCMGHSLSCVYTNTHTPLMSHPPWQLHFPLVQLCLPFENAFLYKSICLMKISVSKSLMNEFPQNSSMSHLFRCYGICMLFESKWCVSFLLSLYWICYNIASVFLYFGFLVTRHAGSYLLDQGLNSHPVHKKVKF